MLNTRTLNAGAFLLLSIVLSPAWLLGDITYNLNFSPGNSPEEQEVANSVAVAASVYNQFGSFNQNWSVYYNSGIPTAEANSNGYMGYGGTRNERVVFHEAAHTFGMGTHPGYPALLSGGVWQGKWGNLAQSETYNAYSDGLHGDGHAIWPGGLNYDSEDGFLNRIFHIRVMAGMRADLGILSFTQEALNEAVIAGETAEFRVESPVAASWQWQKDGQALSNGGDVSGATTSVLRIANADPSDAGSYRCEVTGAGETLQSRPRQLWVHPNAQLGFWGFNGNANDSLGINHGVAFGTPSYAAGKNGQAVDLDGINDYIDLPDPIGRTSEATISAWVQWDGGSDWQRVFDFGTGTDQYLFLAPRVGGGGLRLGLRDPINGKNIEYQVNAPALAIGQWVHLAVVLRENYMTLYTNGQAAGSAFGIKGGTALFPATNNYIGKSQFNDPTFNGRIDDFQVRARAFSGPEVWALWGGSANQAPTFTSQALQFPAARPLLSYGGQSLAVHAMDPESGALTFVKLDGPTWLNVAPDGTMSGQPGLSDGGLNQFVVRVTDPAGASSDATISIQVFAEAGTLLSQESFSAYAVGQLPALLPSPTIEGYTGNWTGVDFGNQRPATAEGTLAYSDPNYQPATGKKLVVPFNTSGGEINAANSGRCFRLLDSTLTVTDSTADTRYLSFLFQTGKETGATTYQTLALYNSNTDDANRIFQFGIYGGTSYQFGANGVDTNTVTPTDTNTHLIVVKFVTSAAANSDTVTLWVDPALTSLEPISGGTTITGKNLKWDRLVFSDYDGNSAAWDEVRWGSTFGSVTTESFLPSIPQFTIQPAAQTSGTVGNQITLSSEALSAPAVTSYQWEKSPNGSTGWTPVSGATSASLTFNPVSFSNHGFFRVIATNANGTAISNTAQLSVTYPPPVIIRQPASAGVSTGSVATFSVTASGVGPLTYQWNKDGNPINGETASSLVVSNVQTSDAASYTVLVTDTAAVADGQPSTSLLSDAANLVVWSGLVSHDPFDTSAGYIIGELPTQNPSITGYSGAWTDVDFGDAEPAISAGSLTYSNPAYLPSTGDKVTVQSNTAGGEINAGNSGRVFRSLAPALQVNENSSGARYLSFLFQSGQETGATTYQTLALYNTDTADANRFFDIGISGGATEYNFGVLNTTYGTGVAANSNVRLIVVKFNLSTLPGADSVTVWIDPIIAGSEPVSGNSTTITDLNLNWDRIAFSDYDGNSAAWDEIRWGSTFGSVTLKPIPPNTYSTWISGYPDVGALSGFDDDADGDGIVNGLENLFGTDPGSASKGITQISRSGNTVTFQHPAGTAPASDVTAEYIWSTDLASFHANGASAEGSTVSFTANTAEGNTTVTATINGTIPEKLFLSLKATH